ncbi:MAG: glycoside hydrolase family 66 protein [Calditrichia bacterium]
MLSASPQQGRIWVIARKSSRHTLYHLINFSDAAAMEWADNSGIQTEPDTIFSLPLSFRSGENIAKLWTASPDFDDCSPREIGFSANSDTISFVLPRLKYWTMVVAETDSALDINSGSRKDMPGNFRLTGNFPNPFNPSTRIEFYLLHRARLRIDIYNTLGQKIITLANRLFGPGRHSVKWQPADNLASGIYICRLYIENQIKESKKLLFMK